MVVTRLLFDSIATVNSCQNVALSGAVVGQSTELPYASRVEYSKLKVGPVVFKAENELTSE